jgi:predicted RNase H-like HicB family nuclease
MRTYRLPVIIERDEDGWYIGTVPALKGCHTQARTLPGLERRLKAAVRLCLAVEHPRPPRHTFIGVHQLELTA